MEERSASDGEGPKGPLTRSGRRFVNIQFQARSGLIANWAISFLVVAPSSFGYSLYILYLGILRLKHQLGSDLPIKLFPR